MDDDRRLRDVARGLGAAAAERVDVERVAAGVVARLRDDRNAGGSRERPWWRRPALLRIAAAVALLVGGGLVAREVLDRREPGLGATLPALVELSTTELEEISDSLSFETPLHESVAVGLEDLTEEQLRELLRLMEG